MSVGRGNAAEFGRRRGNAIRFVNRLVGWVLVVLALAAFTTCTRYALTRLGGQKQQSR